MFCCENFKGLTCTLKKKHLGRMHYDGGLNVHFNAHDEYPVWCGTSKCVVLLQDALNGACLHTGGYEGWVRERTQPTVSD